MKNSKAYLIFSLLLAFPLAQAYDVRDAKGKRRIDNFIEASQEVAQNCALLGFLKNRREKLSATEKAIDTNLQNKLNMIEDNTLFLTVSEYLQALRTKNSDGMTIKDIADNNTETMAFSFWVGNKLWMINGDFCYEFARNMERLEEKLSDGEAKGHGDDRVKFVDKQNDKEKKELEAFVNQIKTKNKEA